MRAAMRPFRWLMRSSMLRRIRMRILASESPPVIPRSLKLDLDRTVPPPNFDLEHVSFRVILPPSTSLTP